ncbi:MAG: metal ABC transporter permease [Candidatus Nanopelagicales bacterium]|nr:metal ABC transporter permease [Candidatus Nanopelagicales bacterium]
MISFLEYDFMQRALIAAALVGLIAPLIGVFLVQRRLALLGDGMGHVALMGVGLAFLLGTAPVPTAMVTAALGAFLIEFIRNRSRTAGDVALALLFYGGIAGGVLFASLAPGKASSSLNSYLFGSLSTVAASDIWALIALAVTVLVILAIFGRELFAVSLDPDIAQVQGIKVRVMSTLMAVLAAIVVVVGMRVVGLLLVSAIMIVPVAAAQQLTRSFRSTAVIAVVIGLIASIAGLAGSFYIEVPPGPAIVILALACFAVLALIAVPIRRRRKELA